jgi:large subunit ribosomal protein L18
MKKSRLTNKKRIHNRIRKKIKGTAERPRLSVYRSNKAIYCQLIDDVSGITLAHATSREEGALAGGTKIDQAKAVGKLIGERGLAKTISKIVFDRGGYLYHGRVKALADGAREAGLQF